MVYLDDIALFVEVASAGTFAGAARRLGMPSNTLSRRVKDLEDRLDVRLMQRSTRKMALTDAGRRLYERCSTQIGDMTQYLRDLSEDNGTLRGRIRIAAPADFFETFRFEWISEFNKLYPAIKLNFLLGDARIDLAANGVDLALRGGDPYDPHYTSRRIGTIQWHWVASPAYLDTHGKPASARELADHDCLVLSSLCNGSHCNLKGPDGPISVKIDGRFFASTLRAIQQAAIAGLGVALLPSAWVYPHIAAGRLQRVLPGRYGHQFDVYWIYTNRTRSPKTVMAFMEFAEKKLVEHWRTARHPDSTEASLRGNWPTSENIGAQPLVSLASERSL